MIWNKGMSFTNYASFVDARTWRAVQRFEFTGGSVKRTSTGLRESADIDCLNYTAGERWIRLYMIARQGDTSEQIPLFTGLACCPDDEIQGFHVENGVQLYSVLKPCEDVLLPLGYYISAGTDGGRAIKKLLTVTPAPVVVEGEAPALKSNLIAEGSETHLSMIEKVLTAINWRLRIEGDGTIHVMPLDPEPVAYFDPNNNDCIEPHIKRTYDWYSCPNVFRATDDELSAVARDDSPDSPLSTVNRGREIWMEETSAKLNEDESLASYALRRLKEEQQVAESIEYDRRFHPDVNVTDVINLNYPAQKLVGRYLVKSQSIEIGGGLSTSEEVVKV